MTEMTSLRIAGQRHPVDVADGVVLGVVVGLPTVGVPVVPVPPPPPPVAPVVVECRAERGSELAGGGDRRDAQVPELLQLVLEGDHDLRVAAVGRAFGVEGLGRAEAHGRRDHAVDLCRAGSGR